MMMCVYVTIYTIKLMNMRARKRKNISILKTSFLCIPVGANIIGSGVIGVEKKYLKIICKQNISNCK